MIGALGSLSLVACVHAKVFILPCQHLIATLELVDYLLEFFVLLVKTGDLFVQPAPFSGKPAVPGRNIFEAVILRRIF